MSYPAPSSRDHFSGHSARIACGEEIGMNRPWDQANRAGRSTAKACSGC